MKTRYEGLVNYILEKGTCYVGVIEGDSFDTGTDFEDWEERARKLSSYQRNLSQHRLS